MGLFGVNFCEPPETVSHLLSVHLVSTHCTYMYIVLLGVTLKKFKSDFRCKNTIFLKVFDEQFSKLKKFRILVRGLHSYDRLKFLKYDYTTYTKITKFNWIGDLHVCLNFFLSTNLKHAYSLFLERMWQKEIIYVHFFHVVYQKRQIRNLEIAISFKN